MFKYVQMSDLINARRKHYFGKNEHFEHFDKYYNIYLIYMIYYQIYFCVSNTKFQQNSITAERRYLISLPN